MAGKKPQAVACQPERRHRRFDLQLPVHLSFSSQDAAVDLDAVSRNVSLEGLLLETSRAVPVGTAVNLTIAVETPQSRRPVQLLGEGEVVRVQRLDSDPGFAIAVHCRRPLSEVRKDLPFAC